jgi:cell division septation protein DedD
VSAKEKLDFKKQSKQKKPSKPLKLLDSPQEPRRFRFELTPAQVLLRTAGFILILIWMFALGVVVGRGLPLIDPTEDTIQAYLVRFLGLAEQPPPPVENASETWKDPEEVLAKLEYQEKLGQEPRPDVPLSSLKKKTTDKASPKSVSEQSPQKEETAQEETPTEDAKGPYALMVASMRIPKYAENLVKKLKAKGYSARVETVTGTGGRPWHRVMVGPFETQKEAREFAAEFNRKENMQGLVVRGER